MDGFRRKAAAKALAMADLTEKGFQVFSGRAGSEVADLIVSPQTDSPKWSVRVVLSYKAPFRARACDIVAVVSLESRYIEYPKAPAEFINLCGEANPTTRVGPTGLTARIRALMKSSVKSDWSPQEIAQALDEDVRTCRERMRLCPTMHKDEATGRYYLDEHLRPKTPQA